MNGGELSEHGDSKHLGHQVCSEEVCDGLVYLEVSRAHPHLRQQPVTLSIGGQEDRVVLSRNLIKLKTRSINRGTGHCGPVKTVSDQD